MMASPYASIASLIKKLDINDDAIIMDRKIKDLTEDFHAVVLEDDHLLDDAFTYFNEHALEDSNFATNFAMLFSSNSLDKLVTNSSKLRSSMLNVLQNNFMKADDYKKKDVKLFYNSITLLGEYYCRYRIAKEPVKILGKSLFELLTMQLEDEMSTCKLNPEHVIDIQFVKLILTQISLNGLLAREKHKDEIDNLLYVIRKCLIEVGNLTTNVKAIFLMTLDLYNSNFTNLGVELEKIYNKFLDDTDKLLTDKKVENPETASTEKSLTSDETINANSLSSVSDLKDILTSRCRPQQNRIFKEYIGKPLKASERLKFAARPNKPPQESANNSEELLSEKLFEKKVEDKKAQDILKKKENVKLNENVDTEPVKPLPNQSKTQTNETNPQSSCEPAISSKDTNVVNNHFLGKPSSARTHRLKLLKKTDDIGDWYDEYQSNHISSPDSNSVKCSNSDDSFNKSNDQTSFDFKMFTDKKPSYPIIYNGYGKKNQFRSGNYQRYGENSNVSNGRNENQGYRQYVRTDNYSQQPKHNTYNRKNDNNSFQNRSQYQEKNNKFNDGKITSDSNRYDQSKRIRNNNQNTGNNNNKSRYSSKRGSTNLNRSFRQSNNYNTMSQNEEENWDEDAPKHISTST